MARPIAQTSLSLVFGRALAAVRKDAGYSQRELLKDAGMRPGSIARLETGKATATIAQIIKLEETLRDVLHAPGTLQQILSLCVDELRDRRIHVLVEQRPDPDIPELRPQRLDRIIAPVIDEWLDALQALDEIEEELDDEDGE